MRWLACGNAPCAMCIPLRFRFAAHSAAAPVMSFRIQCLAPHAPRVYVAYPQVTGIFGSSMEVLISVHGETPAARELVHCGSAYATVVSVNRAGDPVPVPFHIAPESSSEKLRCQVWSATYRRTLNRCSRSP